jgi:hypothetical protein
MPPLALTDDHLATIQRLAEPLHPADRGAYLQRVSALLNGHELGDEHMAAPFGAASAAVADMHGWPDAVRGFTAARGKGKRWRASMMRRHTQRACRNRRS